jgi:hypothetical protein
MWLCEFGLFLDLVKLVSRYFILLLTTSVSVKFSTLREVVQETNTGVMLYCSRIFDI